MWFECPSSTLIYSTLNFNFCTPFAFAPHSHSVSFWPRRLLGCSVPSHNDSSQNMADLLLSPPSSPALGSPDSRDQRRRELEAKKKSSFECMICKPPSQVAKVKTRTDPAAYAPLLEPLTTKPLMHHRALRPHHLPRRIALRPLQRKQI